MKAFSFFGVAALLVAFAIPAEARHGDQVYLQVDRRAEHVPLKQLLRQQTGLRARDYELRGVTIHRSKKDVRKARRRHVDAAVNLRVGRAHTGFIGLHGRSTYVRSPRGFEDRAWQLNFGQTGAVFESRLSNRFEPTRQDNFRQGTT